MSEGTDTPPSDIVIKIDDTEDKDTPDYKALAEEFEGKYKSLQQKHTTLQDEFSTQFKELKTNFETMQTENKSIKRNSMLKSIKDVNPGMSEKFKDADINKLETVLETLNLVKDDFPTFNEGKPKEDKTYTKRYDFTNNKWIKT